MRSTSPTPTSAPSTSSVASSPACAARFSPFQPDADILHVRPYFLASSSDDDRGFWTEALGTPVWRAGLTAEELRAIDPGDIPVPLVMPRWSLEGSDEDWMPDAPLPAEVLDYAGRAPDAARHLSSERVGSVGPGGEPTGSGPHPFGRQTSVAIGGGRVYLGDAAEYSVEVYDFAGHPLPPITWSGPDRDISDRHIALYEDAQVSQASESRRPAMRRWLRDMPRLERFPAYDRLRVDAAGNLWVRHFPKPGATEAEWVIFDGGGAMVGRLAVPLTTTLLELGADYAIVVESDEFDVETVRVMRLVK